MAQKFALSLIDAISKSVPAFKKFQTMNHSSSSGIFWGLSALKEIYFFICLLEQITKNNISLADNLFKDTYSTNCCDVTDEPAEWLCVNGAWVLLVFGCYEWSCERIHIFNAAISYFWMDKVMWKVHTDRKGERLLANQQWSYILLERIGRVFMVTIFSLVIDQKTF